MTVEYVRLVLQLRVKMYTRRFKVENSLYVSEKSIEFESPFRMRFHSKQFQLIQFNLFNFILRVSSTISVG